jgi:hypothetical protein
MLRDRRDRSRWRRGRSAAAALLSARYGQDFESLVPSIAAASIRDEVVEHLVEFTDAGGRHFIVSPAPDVATVGSLVDDVLPAVR